MDSLLLDRLLIMSLSRSGLSKVLLWATSGTVSISVEGVSMHFQFLIEDQSSAALIEILMQRIPSRNCNVTFSCESFKGLGDFSKKNTVKKTKTGKLLNVLATYLRSFNKSLLSFHLQFLLSLIMMNVIQMSSVMS